jgi:hypothetical protein
MQLVEEVVVDLVHPGQVLDLEIQADQVVAAKPDQDLMHLVSP